MKKDVKKLDLVVVGELNADVIYTGLPSMPKMGRCILAEDMTFTLGSASAIFAANSAKLGERVGFAGKVGDDVLGEFIVQQLHAASVETSHIKKEADAKTGLCVCLSDSENYAMASYAGVRETMTADEVSLDYVLSAGHLHLSSYYLQPGMIPGCPALFKKAHAAGLLTSIDPDSDPAGVWGRSIFELLHFVDIFLPNEYEAQHITGRDDARSACEEIKKYCRIAVVKRGARGVVVSDARNTFTCAGFEIDPVDTTGAGDSFNAGFLSAYRNGLPLEECAIRGNACGALSTRAAGGTTAFPSLAELEDFLAHRDYDRASNIQHF